MLEARQRGRGLLPEPPPALTNWPKEKRAGRSETGWNGCGVSSDRGQRRRRGWSPQVSRKTLEALGKAVTPGSKRLEPELRACLSLGSSPSDGAGGSTAALGRQSVVQALGASCLHPSQSGAEGLGHGSVSTHMPCAPGPVWRGCSSLDSTWRGVGTGSS